LNIEFVSCMEYLVKCFAIVDFFSQSENPRNFMLYLPAAVSDFYIPIANMSNHKIQSRKFSKEKAFSLELFNVPKTLLAMRNLNPEMFMVMFKLETDLTMIDKKVLSSMQKYGVDLTIGNML